MGHDYLNDVEKKKVLVFVSYSRKDRTLRETFFSRINPDRSFNPVSHFWFDDSLEPGVFWDREIKDALQNSEIIILLLTQNFLDSHYCAEIEGKAALEMQALGSAKVYGVLLEDCDYKSHGFADIAILPESGVPLQSAANTAQVLQDIVLALKYVVYERFEQKNKDILPPEMPFEAPQCELLDQHGIYGSPRISLAGFNSWFKSGGLILAPFAYVLLEFFFNGTVVGFWPTLLFIVILAVISCAGAIIRENVEKKKTPGWRKIVRLFLEGALVGGILNGLMFGLPLAFFLQLTGISLQVVGVLIISILMGGIISIILYFNTRSKRLRIYQDLVNANLTPKKGWVIDTIGPEFIEKGLMYYELDCRRVETNQLDIADYPLFYNQPDYNTEQGNHTDETAEEIRASLFERHHDTYDNSNVEDDSTPPEPWTPVLFVYHAHDEAQWRELATSLEEEGVYDICKETIFCFDPKESDPAQFKLCIEENKVIVPILSSNFIHSSIDQWIFTEAMQENRGPKQIFPILMEKCNTKLSSMSEIQMLPQNGIPVAEWPINLQAYRNVALNLIENRLPWVRAAVEDQPRFTFKQMGYKFDLEKYLQWIMIHMIVSLFNVAFGWLLCRDWTSPILMSFVLSALPLLISLGMIYKDKKSETPLAAIWIPGKMKITILFKSILLLTPHLILIPLMFYGLLHLWSVLNLNPLSGEFMVCFETAITGGFLVGCAGYPLTCRRQPKVLMSKSPTKPTDILIMNRNRTFTIRLPYEDQVRMEEGNIGNIKNIAPAMRRRFAGGFSISYANLLRICMEALFLGAVGWMIYGALNPQRIFYGLHFTLALSAAIFSQTFLLTLYEWVETWWPRRHNSRFIITLQIRIWFAEVKRLFFYFLCVAAIERVASEFKSDLTAPNLLAFIFIFLVPLFIRFTLSGKSEHRSGGS